MNCLAHERGAQSALSRIISGTEFKRIENNKVVIPLCPRCNDAPFTWRHFFECFRLREVPVIQLKKPDIQHP